MRGGPALLQCALKLRLAHDSAEWPVEPCTFVVLGQQARADNDVQHLYTACIFTQRMLDGDACGRGPVSYRVSARMSMPSDTFCYTSWPTDANRAHAGSTSLIGTIVDR